MNIHINVELIAIVIWSWIIWIWWTNLRTIDLKNELIKLINDWIQLYNLIT